MLADFLFDSIMEMKIRQRGYADWEHVLPKYEPPLPRPPVPAHVAQVAIRARDMMTARLLEWAHPMPRSLQTRLTDAPPALGSDLPLRLGAQVGDIPVPSSLDFFQQRQRLRDFKTMNFSGLGTLGRDGDAGARQYVKRRPMCRRPRFSGRLMLDTCLPACS